MQRRLIALCTTSQFACVFWLEQQRNKVLSANSEFAFPCLFMVIFVSCKFPLMFTDRAGTLDDAHGVLEIPYIYIIFFVLIRNSLNNINYFSSPREFKYV